MKHTIIALSMLVFATTSWATTQAANTTPQSPAKEHFIALKTAVDQYDWKAFEKELTQLDATIQKELLDEIVKKKLPGICANQSTNPPNEQQQQCKNGLAFFSSLIDRYATDIKASLASTLSSAASRGNIELMQFLIGKGTPVDPMDNGPLFAAVKAGNIPAIDLLLSRGANINKPHEFGGDRSYPIFEAIESPDPLQTIKHLIAHGADLNVILTAWGNTQFNLLDAAIVGKEESIPLFFIEKGFKLHERVGPFLLTHEATFRGMPNVLKAFIKNRIPITTKDEGGATALHMLCKQGAQMDSKQFKKTITILINNGIEINDQDNNGNTALHELIPSAESKNIGILLTFKPNPTIKNRAGKTAIDLAREKRDSGSPDDTSLWDAIIKNMEKLAKPLKKK